MNAPTIADWLIAISTLALVFVTLVLAVVAIFQDSIRHKLWHPTLKAKIILEPPDCHKIPQVEYGPAGEQRVVADSYFLRLRVENSGKQRAELVEVFVDELKKRLLDGNTFGEVSEFVPMNLLWSHSGTQRVIFYPTISPGMYRHCELGHIVDPEKRAEFTVIPEHRADWDDVPAEATILHIATVAKPHTLSYLQPPGTYRLGLTVAAANAEPVSQKFEITLTGTWYPDEQRMLDEGIHIKELE